MGSKYLTASESARKPEPLAHVHSLRSTCLESKGATHALEREAAIRSDEA